MTERLHRDVFPAQVFAPNASISRGAVRAFVTDHRVVVWADGGTAEPEVVLDEAVSGDLPDRDRSTQWGGELRLETSHGPVFITRDEGCGCGNPVKRLDPVVPW